MGYYLTSAELVEAVEKHKLGDSEPLALCAYKLGDGLVAYLHRGGFTCDEDEVRQEVVLICLQKALKFQPNATCSNAFGYFTTLSLNHLRALARGNQRFRQLIDKYRKHLEDSEKKDGRVKKVKE